MSIKLASLGNAHLINTSDVTLVDAASSGQPSKVVRSIRLVNNSSEIGVNVSLSGPLRHEHSNPSTTPGPKRLLLPPGTLISGSGLLVIDQEVTLEAGHDSLIVSLTGSGDVDCVVSGFTRDY